MGTIAIPNHGTTDMITTIVPIKLANVLNQDLKFCGSVLSQTSTSLANLVGIRSKKKFEYDSRLKTDFELQLKCSQDKNNFYLLTILPRGVVSKNSIGPLRTLSKQTLCMCIEAFNVVIAIVIDKVITPIACPNPNAPYTPR